MAVSVFLFPVLVARAVSGRCATPSEAVMRQQVRALMGFVVLATLGGAIANACSAEGNADATGATGAGAGSGNGSANGGAGVTSSNNSVGSGFNSSASGVGGSGGSCASVSSVAESKVQPADIVIAVDTSGSMDEESAEVQANLNNFAQIIVNSGVDAHVILIADDSVCIPAPLGSGNCPGGDENLPVYQHVQQGVGSTNALELIISTYPQWKASLRPDALKIIAVVSDDESDISANEFTSQLLALDPPTFDGFKFDAIVSFQDPAACTTACFANFCMGCGICCPNCMPLAAAEGQVYKQLVAQTMGVSGDLCAQDFDAVFADMAMSVVAGAGISCEYDIPMIPGGGTIDPNKVNVNYTPGGGGMPQPVGNVPGGQPECQPATGGWYYDNAQMPTKIIMCPSTCTALQSDAQGKVEVLFGCETVVAVPD
jgi:hypothetical protein